MEERVVTVEFDATIGDKKVDVCGANIVLGINDIPRIELLIPPTQSHNSTPLKPNVSKPNIAEFSKLYQDLSDQAERQSEKGNVNITIKTNSTKSGESKEEIKLKGWVLSGVGLSSISATSAPHLSVILHHPAFFLTKVGSIYLTPKSTSANVLSGSVVNKRSFLEIVDTIYKTYKNKMLFYSAPDKMPEVYMNELGTEPYNPIKYFRDDTKNRLFLGKALGETASPRIASAIGLMACPMGDGSSTWDMILKSTGTLLLSVIQDQKNNFSTGDMGLVIEPSMPWKTKDIISISEDRCMWTEVPGIDMFKIAGVMARKLRIFGDKVSNWRCPLNSNPPDESGVCDVLYSPVEPKHADGRIMKTSAPSVLYQAFMGDGITGKMLTTGFADTTEPWLKGFDNALGVFCRAVYENTYGSMNTAKAQLALSTKDDGGQLILPGNTCKFVSQGVDIYYGYIKNVVHSMAVKGGCSTTINMSNVRPKLDIKEKIPNGNENAAYDRSAP